MFDRRIRLDSISNCRQLGGLVNREGKRIRENALLRSAGLFSATDEDIIFLKERYALGAVVDLRTTGEVTERPDISSPLFEYLRMPVFDDSVIGVTHEEKNEEEARKKRRPIDLAEVYREMVTEQRCRDNYRGILTAIMERRDPGRRSVLWHCTEGKDRCGMTAAFLLTALGVEEDIILEDYLMTNETNLEKSQRFYEMAKRAGEDEEFCETLRKVFQAREEFFYSAFGRIKEGWGTAEDYLTEGLGIDRGLIEEFREKMLE